MLGQRIQRARKALGLSLRALGDHIGLSHAAIKKYEDNVVTPDSEVLITLASVLQVRVEYFFRPVLFTQENIHYSKPIDLPACHLAKITASILDQIEQRVELENLFPVSPVQGFSLRQMNINTYHEIEVVASQIRKQWNLGLKPLANLIAIFAEHGIQVIAIDNQQYPTFDGLSARINKMPMIVIGHQWPGDRQRFTLARELGHWVLKGSFHHLLDEKKCCERFARALLVPKEALITVLGKHRHHLEPRELSILKQKFAVSMMTILHRAQDTDIISNTHYLQLRHQFNERGWSQHEPGEQCPRETPFIFEKMVFHALAEEYIGEAKAAELMNMPLESLRSLRTLENQSVAL